MVKGSFLREGYNRDPLYTAAAESGQLRMLQWLRSLSSPCPWDESTCYNAANNCH